MAESQWRQLLPGQISRLHIYDLATGSDTVIHQSDSAVFEAPNWTSDGGSIIINQDGELYRLTPEGEQMELIDSGMRSAFNNDHVLDPDGRHIFATASDGHIYRFALDSSPAVRVTPDDDGLQAHYLHGVSPDGRVLAHIGGKHLAEGAVYAVYTYDQVSGVTTALTDSPKPHDGSEYSPDGRYIYFNSERASQRPGHSQLFRMGTDGSAVEQLTFDERVNWFPHLSPDGTTMVYISFEPGVLGHPENKPVQLVVADPLARDERVRFDCFGGQGTINVNSWAPDSTRFAYVDYPRADA